MVEGNKRLQNRNGFLVDIGIRAFLPWEETGLKPADLIGKELEFEITRMDEAFFETDVSHRRVLRSRQMAWYRDAAEGDTVEGIVRSADETGALVDLGVVEARLAISGEVPNGALTKGDRVVATIDRIDRMTGAVTLKSNGA
jgi:ribosomal protein S1